MADPPSVVQVRPQRASNLTLRPGTAADIPAVRALGEAVVAATYGPVDPAYDQRVLDEWWTPQRFADTLPRVDREWPDDIWLRKTLGGAR